MRIAMFSDSYYPYISGVTRAIAVARDTLINLGNEVSLFCPAYPGAVREEGVHRFASFRAPTNAGYYVAYPIFRHLSAYLHRDRPDVVHIHSPFNLGKAGWRTARRLGIPVVFTYHTMYNMYSHYVPLFGRSVSGFVEGSALRVAGAVDAVITPSTALADYLKSRGVSSPIHAIPNGIDVHEFRTGDPAYLRRTINIPPKSKVILTCSRLGAEKNVETLLLAFAEARKSVDAFLVLVGDGPLRGRLESLAETLGVSNSTHFTGSVPPERMPHLYAGADMFLFASLTDTQGLVVVEAKAAGLPAVAVGALGVKDMVSHCEDGFLCGNDPGELARRITELLGDPATLASMKAAAMGNASRFSKEASAKRLLDCYQSVLR
ncbi:MAG: glycosyltransferase family 4 protein [Bacillota bacterium]